MNFRDLEYLVAVARFSHFGQAAAHCHVSQSALSLQLQKLEREVGIQLLERTSRSVVVTEAGREAIQRARELLQQKQELLDAARHFDGGLPERVRIGAIPTIAPYLFERLCTGLRRSHPRTTALFEELVTEELTAALVQGELDAGILATPVTDSLLDTLDLFEEPFVAAVSIRHPLAKARYSSIKPTDLASESLLLLKDAHCLSGQVLDFCAHHKVTSERKSVAASIATLLALVRATADITLIPEMALPENGRSRGLRYLPITPPPTRDIRVAFRKTSQVGRQLAETIHRALGE